MLLKLTNKIFHEINYNYQFLIFNIGEREQQSTIDSANLKWSFTKNCSFSAKNYTH